MDMARKKGDVVGQIEISSRGKNKIPVLPGSDDTRGRSTPKGCKLWRRFDTNEPTFGPRNGSYLNRQRHLQV